MTKQLVIKPATYEKDVLLSMRTNSQIKKELEALAKRRGMNLTDYINEMMIERLKQEGISITVNHQL
jgi:antitoxin component of RelBE/YafQ-DinJ toxin-antitoxin module